MAALSQAPGATVTLDSGSVTTAAQLGSGVWAIGSETISPGSIFTLGNSQVLSAGSSDLHLDGTAVHATAPATTGFAVLAGPETTVTAYQVPGTTGVGVVNGQTISYRGSGVTLDTGEVVSMAWDGVEDRTQTVEFSSTAGIYPVDSTTSRSIDFSATTGQVYPIPGSSTEESTGMSSSMRRTGTYTATETNTDTDTSTTSVYPVPTSSSSMDSATETAASSTTGDSDSTDTSTATGAGASETIPSGSGRVHLAWSTCCLGVLLLATVAL